MITQKKMAKDLNVSFRTVSRYINNNGYVGEETGKRIEEYIRKHNYRPNKTARSLVLRKSQLIGVLVPSIKSSYYPEIIEIVNSEMKANGYNILLSVSDEDTDTEREEIEILRSVPVDGIILSPTSSKASVKNCELLAATGIPYVLIDRYYSNIPCSFVSTKSREYSRKLAEYLISMGHWEIALINGPSSNSFAKDIHVGYRAALKKAGIDYRPELVMKGAINEKNGYESAVKIFESSKRPTAIQAANDEIAIGIYKAAEKYKVRIPEDLSVVGFSDIGVSSLLNPPLTTVREDTSEIACRATEILMNMLNGNTAKETQVFIDGEVIIRKSVRKIA